MGGGCAGSEKLSPLLLLVICYALVPFFWRSLRCHALSLVVFRHDAANNQGQLSVATRTRS